MLLVLYLYELVCYSYVLVSCFSHNPKIPPQSEYMRKFPFQKNRRLKISLMAIFLLCILFCSLKLVGNYFLYSPYHIRRNHSDSVSDDTSKVLPSRLVSAWFHQWAKMWKRKIQITDNQKYLKVLPLGSQNEDGERLLSRKLLDNLLIR